MLLRDDHNQPGYGEIRIEAGSMPGIVLMDFQKDRSDAQHFLGGAPLRAVEINAILPTVTRELGRRHVPARLHAGTAAPSREAR